MSHGVFNIAKGKLAYYASLPEASDLIVIMLLQESGLVDDDTLKRYDTVEEILAGGSLECDFFLYGRKQIANVVATVNDVDDQVELSGDSVSWVDAGAGNDIAKLIVCYWPVSSGGDDATRIPLTYHDFVYTTDGSTFPATINAPGFARAI